MAVLTRRRVTRAGRCSPIGIGTGSWPAPSWGWSREHIFLQSSRSGRLHTADLSGVCPHACGVENCVHRGGHVLIADRSERSARIVATNCARRSMRSFRSPFDGASSSPSARTRSRDEAESASAQHLGRSLPPVLALQSVLLIRPGAETTPLKTTGQFIGTSPVLFPPILIACLNPWSQATSQAASQMLGKSSRRAKREAVGANQPPTPLQRKVTP